MTKKTKDWLKSINKSSSILPDENIIEELAPYIPSRSIMIYRGLFFKDRKDFDQKMRISFPEEGETISGDFGSHWTYSHQVAKEFANRPDHLGIVLACEVYPEEVLVDLDKLPLEIKEELEFGSEQEVILFKCPDDVIVYWVKE